MIIVLGSVVVVPGRLDEALAASREHVLRSRAEPGCIAHAVHRDTEHANRLVFVEQWQDLAALQAHFQVPETRRFARALAAMAAEPPELSMYRAEAVSPSAAA